MRVPRLFELAELADRAAVGALYGGGKYEVIGRDGKCIRARSTFRLEGASLPIGAEPGPAKARPRARDQAREFATPAGRREALVFEMLDQGHHLIDIAKATAIDARTLRGIFDEWRALHALGEAHMTVLHDRVETRRAVLERES